MEVRVLGPLEVLHEGGAHPVGGAKARALLSLLAIRPNEPCSPEVLIDELWEGAPPASAASALRVYITQVRAALEPQRSKGSSTRLPHARAGYVLRLSVDELDASKFESLVLRGREAALQGEVGAADVVLAEALRHWRGPPLIEVRGLSAVRSAITRLDQLRLSALEELGEARLALGKHKDVVDTHMQAVADFPLAERLTAQLMLSLYRGGRQADALRVFSSLARRLDDELGTKPSAEVRQLEEDMLLQRDRLDFVAGGEASESAIALTATTPRLVGRRVELGQLLDLCDTATGGARRLAVVAGTAGIGKTSLTTEFARRATAQGATVLSAACAPDADSASPIAQVLQACVATLDVEVPDSANDELQLIEVVARAIGARPNCPILLVEDVHWADDGTLLALRRLLRHDGLSRLLVVVTYRGDEVSEQLAKTIARLAPRDCTETVTLTGLNEHEVRSLVRSVMGPQVVPTLLGVAVTLRDATDGNPLYLRALLEELAVPARAAIEHAELARIIETRAPKGVRALAQERIDRLSENGRRVARTAATISREISPDLLSDVCGLGIDEVLDAVDEAVGAGLTVEDARDLSRYEFSHDLFRNAIYFGIPEPERRALHLRIAEAMEARNTASPLTHSDSELAKHFRSALPDADLGKAAYFAERAGHDAASRVAFAESVQWYEFAIDCAERLGVAAADRARLDLALAEAYQGERKSEPAREAYARAAAHAQVADDPTLLADIALSASTTWISGFISEEWARALLEDALARLDDADGVRRVRVLARLATRLFYIDPAESRRCSREAVAVGETLGDAAVLSEALLSQRLALTREPSACRDQLALTRRALRLCGDAPSVLGLRVRRELLTDLLFCAELDAFETELDRYEQQARDIFSLRDSYWAMVLRATEATWHGNLDAGEQLARGAGIRGADVDATAAGAEYLQRFVIRFQQGRMSEMVGDPTDTGAARPVYRAGAALSALAQAETGRVEDALNTARWAVGADGQGIARDSLWLAAHALFAVVAFTAGDLELAALLDELIAPYADQLVIFGAAGAVLGCGHHWLGLLAHTRGMTDRAVQHLTAAADVSARLRAPYWLAQARLDLAIVLETRNGAHDQDRAIGLRAEARRAAEAGGFGRIIARSIPPT